MDLTKMHRVSVKPSAFDNVQVGDKLIRNFGRGELKNPVSVTEITDTQIICSLWTFDRRTGAEIDEDLNWGNHGTGTYLSLI